MHKTVVRTRNLSQATRHSPPGGVDCWARDYTQAIYVVAGCITPQVPLNIVCQLYLYHM